MGEGRERGGLKSPRSPKGDGGAGARRSERRRAMLAEVVEGLSRPQKELSPKYFYDHRGSELFERITRLPEYYLTRTEEALLESEASGWIRALRPRTLVELGAGSARKTRVLLDAMVEVGSGRAFVPVDVSGDFLRQTVAQVRDEYPDLDVEPVVADITRPLGLRGILEPPVLFVLLGSTIGNFPGESGVELLDNVASVMEGRDWLLLGADLRPGAVKTVETVEAAYNDPAGVTAAFNLNVLSALNQALGSDFRLDAFQHMAFYDEVHGRVEMHLKSLKAQDVTFPGAGVVSLTTGETIRTEISEKYDRESLGALMDASGLALERWTQDPAGRFSLSLCRLA